MLFRASTVSALRSMHDTSLSYECVGSCLRKSTSTCSCRETRSYGVACPDVKNTCWYTHHFRAYFGCCLSCDARAHPRCFCSPHRLQTRSILSKHEAHPCLVHGDLWGGNQGFVAPENDPVRMYMFAVVRLLPYALQVFCLSATRHEWHCEALMWWYLVSHCMLHKDPRHRN